jgi:isopenicillin-N N-acyltransferase like protein
MICPVPQYSFSGTGWQLGFQHGAALRAQIQAFIGDDLQRLNQIRPQPTSIEALAPTLKAYHEEIARQLPESVEEIEGLANGADISFDQALLLQLRREIAGYSRRSQGDCTTFARHSPEDIVVAQTVDLNGNLDTEAYVMRVTSAGRDRRELIMLTFTGLLGYLGMNDRGLAIGLNLVMGGDWRAGVPGYLAIRHLLETATSVQDCVDLLDNLRLASSRSLTICDRNSAAVVEIFEGQRRWTSGAELVHTNHFLDTQFSLRDEINVFARNGSIARRASCTAALAELPPTPSLHDYFSILDRPPICIPPDGNVRREATVARAVMRPGAGEFAVRLGAGRDGREHVFRMGAPS